jgi:hypothetical protein
MKTLWLAVPLVVASMFPASADEKVINLKLVGKTLQMKDGEAQVFGVTFAPDGRIGTKEYTFNPADGTGRSTYYFDDGSVTTTFGITSNKDGRFKGDYTILSGTGAYKGAKGTGTIDGRDPTKSGLKGASLMDIVLKLDIPKTN